MSFYKNIIACGGKSEGMNMKNGIVKIIDISDINRFNEVQKIQNLAKIIGVFFSENGKYLII